MIKVYTKHDPPTHDGISFLDEVSLTQQHFKKECDISEMLRKFGATGELPNKEGAFYGDFSDSISFQDSLDLVLSTQEQFDSLPSACRDRFGNDVGKFLDFVSNPENKQHFASLGLTEVKVPVPPLDVTGTADTIETPATQSSEVK